MSTTEAAPTGRLAELRASARGWHGVQLAVLGFIGLCGVLKPAARTAPDWLQTFSLLLLLAALATACLATFLVGRAAWPLYGRSAPADDDPGAIDQAARWLKTGLLLTFLAVALAALGALSGWWPAKESGGTETGAVQLEAGSSSWCGTVATAGPGTVRIDAGGQLVDVPLAGVSAIRSVSTC